MYELAKAKVKAAEPIFGLVQKPTPLCYIGAGKVKEVGKILKSYNIDNVFIMTDKVLFELGLLNAMIEEIEKLNIKVSLFSDIKPDPTFGIVESALEICKKDNCKAVIAFGGGSVIDSAKTVASAASNGVAPKQLEGMLKVKKEALPFIAIPTTAGTGSEVTLVAVISDDVTHKKTTIISPKIVPKVAILDPELTTGLPKHITSSTAMDALTHALEAFTNSYATEETDQYAKNAINLICNNIEIAYNNPTDLEAREALLVGSFYAGMAFTRAQIGYVHAFSHNIGGKFGIPHGLANAVLLPHVMESFKDIAKIRFAELSDMLNIIDKSKSIAEKSDAFIQYLFDLNKRLELPEKLEKFPRNGVNEILEAGFKECHGNYPIPRYYTKEEGLNILNKVCAD